MPPSLIIMLNFALLFLLGYLLIRQIKVFQQAKASKYWPHTQGKILESQLITRSVSGRSYSYQVKFEYRVHGQTLSSKNIQLNPWAIQGVSLSSRKKAMQQVAKYSSDSLVTVYYNPEDPKQAILTHTAPFTHCSVIFYTSLLFLLQLYSAAKYI